MVFYFLVLFFFLSENLYKINILRLLFNHKIFISFVIVLTNVNIFFKPCDFMERKIISFCTLLSLYYLYSKESEGRLRLGSKNKPSLFCTSLGLHYLCISV